MTDTSSKDKSAKSTASEPTIEERVTAIEAAIGLKASEDAPLVAPDGPPAPHELYVPGDAE